MKLAEKLERLLDGQNRAHVAREAGLSPPILGSYVNRGSMPGADTALKLARALKVPLDWLADDAAEWPPPVPDQSEVATLSDHDLMHEASRRFLLAARRASDALDSIEKIDWVDVAGRLLAFRLADPLPDDLERASFLLGMLDSLGSELRAYDASATFTNFINLSRSEAANIVKPGEFKGLREQLIASTPGLKQAIEAQYMQLVQRVDAPERVELGEQLRRKLARELSGLQKKPRKA